MPDLKKNSRWNSQKKSPNQCLRSRPLVDVATWIPFICSSSVATNFLQLHQVSSVATKFLAASLISGSDLNCGRDLFGSVFLKN